MAAEVLLLLLPYVALGLFSWRLNTDNRVKVWVYLGVVVIVTLLAVINNGGLGPVQPGYLGVEFFVLWQTIGFAGLAGWVSDRNEW